MKLSISTNGKNGSCRALYRVTPLVSTLLVLPLLGLRLTAQERLTAASLSDWTTHGDRPVVDTAGVVTIPAGGGLSRTFASTDALSVRLVSQPYFGIGPSTWPGLEVGPATLTFTRGEGGGALVLLGDEVLPLSFTIPLDAAGRSQQPLDFTLSYGRTASGATLAIRGQNFTLRAAPTDQPNQVALTAGGEASWRIDSLEITATNEATANQSSGAAARGTASTSHAVSAKEEDARAVLNGETLRQIADLLTAGKQSEVLALLGRKSRWPATSSRGHLEVAHRCLHVAVRFSAGADFVNTAKMANLAREEARLAARGASGAGSSDLLADAYEFIGLIEERFMGDLSAAQTSYATAIRWDGQRAGPKRSLDRVAKPNIRKN